MPSRTALIVPVPEADALVVDAPPGVGAHVTVLAWFLDPAKIDEAAIAGVLAPFATFDFELDGVEVFADGITWLHPEPSSPFVELTNAVWNRWPECPPYGGAHADVVPHLTIAKTPVDVDAAFPIRCRATEVHLIEENEDGVFRVRRAFPLEEVEPE
jgi:2'-5' RNA ligase